MHVVFLSFWPAFHLRSVVLGVTTYTPQNFLTPLFFCFAFTFDQISFIDPSMSLYACPALLKSHALATCRLLFHVMDFFSSGISVLLFSPSLRLSLRSFFLSPFPSNSYPYIPAQPSLSAAAPFLLLSWCVCLSIYQCLHLSVCLSHSCREVF